MISFTLQRHWTTNVHAKATAFSLAILLGCSGAWAQVASISPAVNNLSVSTGGAVALTAAPVITNGTGNRQRSPMYAAA